jgi:hypothetical protein
MRDINGTRKEFRRCDVYDAQKTLGVHLALDGNHSQQILKMREIAAQWADSMKTGRIPKDDARLAF